MTPLSVAEEGYLDTPQKQEPRSFHAGMTQHRANNTVLKGGVEIVTLRRVLCPYTELASHESHQPLTYQEPFMKKSLATLLIAGALAVAGLSATSAISASGENAGQGSVQAVNWWPNSTPKF
jgi:hypothetical protein